MADDLAWVTLLLTDPHANRVAKPAGFAPHAEVNVTHGRCSAPAPADDHTLVLLWAGLGGGALVTIVAVLVSLLIG